MGKSPNEGCTNTRVDALMWLLRSTALGVSGMFGTHKAKTIIQKKKKITIQT